MNRLLTIAPLRPSASYPSRRRSADEPDRAGENDPAPAATTAELRSLADEIVRFDPVLALLLERAGRRLQQN